MTSQYIELKLQELEKRIEALEKKSALDKYKAESDDTETWNGVHAHITAPKGTFEKIFNDKEGDDI